MSRTSLSRLPVSLDRNSHSIEPKKPYRRRYSDFNILFLEGRHKVSHEEQKTKLLKKKEDWLLDFEKKFIYKQDSTLKPNIHRVKFPNGNMYVGELVNEQREGYGILTYTCGDIYFGGWSKGKFNGYGIYAFAKGEIYKGQFSHGKKEGQG